MIVVVVYLLFQVREVSFDVHAIGATDRIDFGIQEMVEMSDPFHIVDEDQVIAIQEMRKSCTPCSTYSTLVDLDRCALQLLT